MEQRPTRFFHELEAIMHEGAPAAFERADGVGQRRGCFRACVRKCPVDGAARRAF